MAAIDPNSPVIQAGETAANFALRVQAYTVPASGPCLVSAQQVLAFARSPTVPSAWSIQ